MFFKDNKLSIILNEHYPALDAALAAKVDRIWTIEQAKRHPHLFNGRIISVDAIDQGIITGHVTEYKYFIAQYVNPSLYDMLRVRPLAVSGLLECQEGYVFGFRSGLNTQDQYQWELVPSGTVDIESLSPFGQMNYGTQLLTELREEIGLNSDDLVKFEPFSLLEDETSHVVDIGIYIEVMLSFDEIKQIFLRNNNREYTELRVVAMSEIDSFLTSYSVSETSRKLLISWRKK